MLLRLADKIIHQKQPTPCSCTATCVAMALGVPVAELGVELGRGWGQHHFGVWLAERGIWLKPCDRGELMHDGALYLATVPSLNKVASSHCVLVDTRGIRDPSANRSHWRTYDPQFGVEGKNHYEWVDHHYSNEFYKLHDRANYGRIVGAAS